MRPGLDRARGPHADRPGSAMKLLGVRTPHAERTDKHPTGQADIPRRVNGRAPDAHLNAQGRAGGRTKKTCGRRAGLSTLYGFME